MKDFRDKEERMQLIYPFITNYHIENGELIINFSNRNTQKVPYSKDVEIRIIEAMKKQIYQASELESLYKRRMDNNKFYTRWHLVIGLVDIIASLQSKHPFINLSLGTVILTLSYLYSINASEDKERLKEIEKHRLFLLFECQINEDIINHYNEMVKANTMSQEYEPNTMTINDLDNYSLEEIKEMIELISQSEDYKLELKKA